MSTSTNFDTLQSQNVVNQANIKNPLIINNNNLLNGYYENYQMVIFRIYTVYKLSLYLVAALVRILTLLGLQTIHLTQQQASRYLVRLLDLEKSETHINNCHIQSGLHCDFSRNYPNFQLSFILTNN